MDDDDYYDAMFCAKCGASLSKHAEFCGKCGTPIRTSYPTKVADEYIVPRVGSASRNDGTSGIPKGLLVLFLLMLLLLGGAFFYAFFLAPTNLTPNVQPVIPIIQPSPEPLLEPPAPVVREYRIYVEAIPFIPNVSADVYTNAWREAKSHWEQREPNIIFREVGTRRDADVVVSWVKEFGGAKVGHVVRGDFVQIGLGDSLCNSLWRIFKYEDVRLIAIHEIGHVLGKPHTSNPEDVMFESIITRYDFEEESDTLIDGDTIALPLCTGHPQATYLIKLTSSQPLEIWVVPSKIDVEHLFAGDDFNHYPDCRASLVTTYELTCRVEAGSFIVLENPCIFCIGGRGNDADYTVLSREN